LVSSPGQFRDAPSDFPYSEGVEARKKARWDMKKEKVANIVFWLVFFALVINWHGLFSTIHKVANKPSKPMMSQELRNEHLQKKNDIIKGLYDIGLEKITPQDYYRSLFSLKKLEDECDKYSNPAFNIMSCSNDLHFIQNSMREKYLRQDEPFGMLMFTAMAEVEKETGYRNSVLNDAEVNEGLKHFLFWLLKSGFIGFCLAPFLFIQRCWLRKQSAKELLLMQPLDFIKHMLLWPSAVIVGYPQGTVGVAWEYHRLRSRYLSEKGWRYNPSKEEEQMFWQQARQRLDKFDAGLAQAVSYSKTVAFVSTLIIWLLMPFKKGLAATAQKEDAPITRMTGKFSGFSLLKYTKDNGFQIPLVVLKLEGSLAKEFDYKLEFNAANTGDTLREAWVSWKAADWLKFTFGQQFMFYTKSLPPNMWQLVDYSAASDLATLHDIGIVAKVDTQYVELLAGVINGSGRKWADDGKFDMYFHPTIKPFEGFSVGAVFQTGQQKDGYRKKYGGHVELILPKFHVLAEHFSEEMGSEKKSGWYVIGVWSASDKLQLIAQYDEFQEQLRKKNLTLGAVFDPNKNLRFRLNTVLEKMKHAKMLASLQFSF